MTIPRPHGAKPARLLCAWAQGLDVVGLELVRTTVSRWRGKGKRDLILTSCTASRKLLCSRLVRVMVHKFIPLLALAALASVIAISCLLSTRDAPGQEAVAVLPKRALSTNTDTTTNPQRDQLVMITDNPFLIPSMPEQRKMELFRSIKMNLESPYVAGVHILNEAPNNQTSLHPSDKLRIYNLGWRSTFLDAIRYANAKLPPGTAFAVANADIVFAHESIRLVTRIKDPRVVITLSRHEVREDGTATLHADPALSQDVWIMRTPFPEDAGFDFPMGTLGSDNKLAYLYSDRLNMTLENWCSDVVTWHLHVSQIRSAKARIPQPYKAAPPKRANLSMLAYEWADAALLPMPRASFAREVFGRHGPRVLSLDIPRIADQGLQHSQLSVDKLAPEWTSSSVWELLAHAKKRRRVRLRLLTKKTTTTTTTTATNTTDRQSVFGGHDGLRSESSSSRQYLLDLPWSSLARERMLDANASLIRSLLENAPADFAFENACAIVPAEVLRPLCLGAPEWSRMTLGVVENGRFGGFVACPPREV